MKNIKKTIIIFCLIMTTNLLNAQVFLGVNSKIGFEKKYNTTVQVYKGIGIDLLVGYSLQQKMDFSISISNYSYGVDLISLLTLPSSVIKVRSIKTNAKYYILQKSIRPYIGFGLGYFKFVGYEDNVIGIIPSVGLLFDLNFPKGLFLNTEFSYYKIYTRNYELYTRNHATNINNFNIGLVYYFKSKNKDNL